MRVPISWVREFAETDLDHAQIADRLTMGGIEVEASSEIGAASRSVVVGKILESQPVDIAKGKQAFLLTLDVGKRISCLSLSKQAGEAPSGTLIAVALEGAVLFDADSEEPFAIKEVKAVEAYGRQSTAVLCSQAELGTGEDHSSVVFVSETAKPGAPIGQVLADGGISDVVLQLSILANIARCQSMLGVAREVAALCKGRFRDERTSEKFEAEAGNLRPSIESQQSATRLTVTLVEGITVVDSPKWLQRRLRLCGVAVVNNIVDASNYVMLEMGQPTHAYSADSLPDLSLGARLSRASETIRTLAQAEQDEPLVLPADIPLIVSADQPVAIAGVIGGFDTRVTPETRRILIEAASFDMFAIRRSQAELKIYTDASARFSRGVDPHAPRRAVERLLAILRLTCPDARVVGAAEALVPGAIPEASREIELSVTEVNRSLGTRLSLDEVAEPLERLGFSVRRGARGETLSVLVGSDRNDIGESCDLVEEIARVRGYDLLESTMPVEPVPFHSFDAPLYARERVRDALVQAGLYETINYTLTSLEATEALCRGSRQPSGPVLTLLNPVSNERKVVRRSLLPGLLEVYALNARHRRGCRLFEIGTVALPELAQPASSLPFETMRLGILVGGAVAAPTLHEPKARQHDFFDLKSIVERVVKALKLYGVSYEAASSSPFVDGACARLRVGETTFGYMGLIHPLVAEFFDLGNDPVFGADIDIEGLTEFAGRVATYREIQRFPIIELDIAAVVNDALTAKALLDVAREHGGPLLRHVEVFDVYKGAPIAETDKGIGLRLNIAALDRTLQMEEAFAVRSSIADALRTKLKATIREG